MNLRSPSWRLTDEWWRWTVGRMFLYIQSEHTGTVWLRPQEHTRHPTVSTLIPLHFLSDNESTRGHRFRLTCWERTKKSGAEWRHWQPHGEDVALKKAPSEYKSFHRFFFSLFKSPVLAIYFKYSFFFFSRVHPTRCVDVVYSMTFLQSFFPPLTLVTWDWASESVPVFLWPLTINWCFHFLPRPLSVYCILLSNSLDIPTEPMDRRYRKSVQEHR